MVMTRERAHLKQLASWLLVMVVGVMLPASGCQEEVQGCTDPGAANYDPAATVNDGSCTYETVYVHPVWSKSLPDEVDETSGLLALGDGLLTHNDNGDTRLYMIDTASGALNGTIDLPGVENVDWEDVAQDEAYIYVGDFGNNSEGNRTDLKVYRVRKASLDSGIPEISVIEFAYADQGEPIPLGPNSTDYDCEAMVVIGDSLCLFTKQWTGGNSSAYFLPKVPGSYLVSPSCTLPVGGQVTGATRDEATGTVVLLGYNLLLQPFFYLLYDYRGYDFMSGFRRKVHVQLTFYQTEGIAPAGDHRFFVSNEQFVQVPYVDTPQQLHQFDLEPFLTAGE